MAGGIWDQPAGAWYSRNYAARVWQMLETIEKPDFNAYNSDFDGSDQDLYKEIIAEQQKQQKARNRA